MVRRRMMSVTIWGRAIGYVWRPMALVAGSGCYEIKMKSTLELYTSTNSSFMLLCRCIASRSSFLRATIVYASPCRTSQSILWTNLEAINISNSWMLIGDFNLVLYGHERCSGESLYKNFLLLFQHLGSST